MLNFEPTIRAESQQCSGVAFTVRRLSLIERSKRDMALADQQIRLAEIATEIDKLLDPFRDRLNAWIVEHPDVEPDFIPSEVAHEVFRLRHEQRCITDVHLKPATIRAAFVSLEGIEYGGKPATADLLLTHGPDLVIEEMYTVIQTGSALSIEQRKNSSSPSDLPVPEDGGENSTIAEPAEIKATT